MPSDLTVLEGAKSPPQERRKPQKLSSVRYTITVSPATEERLTTLKEYTEAETVSEVFREAINIAALLMKLEREGVYLEIVNPEEPDKRERLVIGKRVAA